jgi:hypothetical protein
MHEDVLPARVRGDEAVAFGRVEPLNGALGHRRVAFLPAGVTPRASHEAAAQFVQERNGCSVTPPPLRQDPHHYVTDLMESPAKINDTRPYASPQSIL